MQNEYDFKERRLKRRRRRRSEGRKGRRKRDVQTVTTDEKMSLQRKNIIEKKSLITENDARIVITYLFLLYSWVLDSSEMTTVKTKRIANLFANTKQCNINSN